MNTTALENLAAALQHMLKPDNLAFLSRLDGRTQDEIRQGLQTSLNRCFCRLNAQAMQQTQRKGRWDK